MHPDAEVVMRGFQAFAEGDMAAMKEVFADDAVWHTSGRNKWSGDHRGADAILRLFGDITSEASLDNQLHAILADDEHVVVLVNTSAQRNGKSYDGDTVFIFHVSDGRATEVWSIPRDPYALDEFWAD